MEIGIKRQAGYILAVVLGVLLLLGQCERRKIISEKKRLKSNIEALQDTIKYKENKIGSITASKRALEVSEKELKNEVYVKDQRILKLTKEFNKLKSVTKIDQEVKLENIPIVYPDTIPYVFNKKFDIKEEWYSIEGFSNQKGINIKNLTLPNEQFVIIGEKKKGLFKPNYLTVDVVNTNPNIKTLNIETQVIEQNTPFYNKFWFRLIEVFASFGLGASTGR